MSMLPTLCAGASKGIIRPASAVSPPPSTHMCVPSFSVPCATLLIYAIFFFAVEFNPWISIEN